MDGRVNVLLTDEEIMVDDRHTILGQMNICQELAGVGTNEHLKPIAYRTISSQYIATLFKLIKRLPLRMKLPSSPLR